MQLASVPKLLTCSALAEQAVLDWVPLGRTWWIVCDRDVQTVLVAQLVLDAVFPCTAGCAVASASVSYDK